MDKSQKDKAPGIGPKTRTTKKTAQVTFTSIATHSGFTQSTITKPAVWSGLPENLNCQTMPNEAPKELIMELQSLALRYGVLKSTQASLMEEYAVLRKAFVELLELYNIDKSTEVDEYWLDKAWLL